MSGLLPAATLCAALGFALSFAPRRTMPPALGVLVLAAVLSSLAPWGGFAVLAAWCSVLVTAACVHLPRGVSFRLSIALALNAGLWAGAAMAGHSLHLSLALPWALICIPGAWLVTTRRQIVLKVASSWLVAVAVLAVGLPTLSTPASAPDHME